jgi:hypothetical protein
LDNKNHNEQAEGRQNWRKPGCRTGLPCRKRRKKPYCGRICAINQEVGTVERGKIADLFIVGGNPLDDLECIYNIKMVIKEGCIVVEK